VCVCVCEDFGVSVLLVICALIIVWLGLVLLEIFFRRRLV
jgi:hypothetical protein